MTVYGYCGLPIAGFHLRVCVIVNCISTLRIRFPRDKNLPKSCCSPKSPRQQGYQPNPGTMRVHSVSQILLYHEMSQHISYKRDYLSLTEKERGSGSLTGDRETRRGEERRGAEPMGMCIWIHADAYMYLCGEYKLGHALKSVTSFVNLCRLFFPI